MLVEDDNQIAIKCPSCGYEYLPGEIYLPKHFLGQPTEIEHDYEGKVLYHEGTNMNLEETYTCDKCHKTFKVSANVSFVTKLAPELDVKDDYIQPLYLNRLVLEEDSDFN